MDITLLYSEDARYDDKLKRIRRVADDISEKWDIKIRFIDISNLDNEQIEIFKTNIRSTLPQVRGKIVTSRNYLLPLSNERNLNVSNTPIAVIFDKNNKSLDVYPHLLGTFYIDVEQFMKKLLKDGPHEYYSLRGFLEDPLKKLLSDAPYLFEEGTQFIGSEVETSVGSIDILLQGKDGEIIVVEIETHARDNAVSQVCRLASGYAEMTQHPLNSIKKVIICIDYDSAVIDASKGAGVEVYKVNFKRVIR